MRDAGGTRHPGVIATRDASGKGAHGVVRDRRRAVPVLRRARGLYMNVRGALKEVPSGDPPGGCNTGRSRKTRWRADFRLSGWRHQCDAAVTWIRGERYARALGGPAEQGADWVMPGSQTLEVAPCPSLWGQYQHGSAKCGDAFGPRPGGQRLLSMARAADERNARSAPRARPGTKLRFTPRIDRHMNGEALGFGTGRWPIRSMPSGEPRLCARNSCRRAVRIWA